MPLSDEDLREIDEALLLWRQGDATLDDGLEFRHVADLYRPHSEVSKQVVDSLIEYSAPVPTGQSTIQVEVQGLVVLTQTCDIVRNCYDRPYVEVAPLVPMSNNEMEEIRRLKRPAFAYVPATANRNLVADLDRTMTVEKAIVAGWKRVPGCETEAEQGAFVQALTRKRSRFAFPDDFVQGAQRLQERLTSKHSKNTEEGEHLRCLREIRVRAYPSWNDSNVNLTWWFIKEEELQKFTANWQKHSENWISLFNQDGRFRCNLPISCWLENLTAREYTESKQLDLDYLSSS